MQTQTTSTITAKDLRVGNIVDREKTGHPLIITAEHIFHWDKFKGVLFPMALTPEILEKCGFERTEEPDSVDDDLNPISGYKNWQRGNFCFTRNDNDGIDHDAPLFYLHQLQNLYFALTGEELEINL